MEEQEEPERLEIGKEEQQKEKEEVGEPNALQFLDSVDGYLTLLDSLSSTLRQGWLELASARHSMGASRLNTAVLDLKFHSAVTSLQVSECDVDSMVTQPHFALRKWASPDNGRWCSEEEKSSEDKLQRKSDSPQLRHRSTPQFSGTEIQDKTSASNRASVTVDDQVQKERSKSLSVFGTLVSPKLRAAQLTFETALEKLVEIANMRSLVLSSFDKVQKELEGTKG